MGDYLSAVVVIINGFLENQLLKKPQSSKNNTNNEINNTKLQTNIKKPSLQNKSLLKI